MTAIDRGAIRARAEAATPGPWEANRNGYVYQPAPFDLHRFDIMDVSIAEAKELIEDADFIAHAREDIPALLAALEEAEGKLAKIADLRRYTLDSFDQMSPMKPGAKNGLLYGEELDTILDTKEQR